MRIIRDLNTDILILTPHTVIETVKPADFLSRDLIEETFNMYPPITKKRCAELICEYRYIILSLFRCLCAKEGFFCLFQNVYCKKGWYPLDFFLMKVYIDYNSYGRKLFL